MTFNLAEFSPEWLQDEFHRNIVDLFSGCLLTSWTLYWMILDYVNSVMDWMTFNLQPVAGPTIGWLLTYSVNKFSIAWLLTPLKDL